MQFFPNLVVRTYHRTGRFGSLRSQSPGALDHRPPSCGKDAGGNNGPFGRGCLPSFRESAAIMAILRYFGVVALSAIALFSATSPAAAQTVSVTVNGQPMALSPGPIERAGRVFVPLRGIFERLGAAVVYSSGTINAT